MNKIVSNSKSLVLCYFENRPVSAYRLCSFLLERVKKYLISNHKQQMFWRENRCGGWHLLVLHKSVIGEDNGAGPS